MRRINFSSYDSSYIDSGLNDGTMMKFFPTTESSTIQRVMYGDKAPSALCELGSHITEMKKHMELMPIGKFIPFLHKELPEPAIDMEKNYRLLQTSPVRMDSNRLLSIIEIADF